ncbi:ATP-binding protein [Falsibacillus albus]|uniref:histidine kinase n=1 Tax=Falsibacillus albus TaxID=2478915 RepID=A0A3L7JTN0_9BACI|nr:ATP-binding protein [Falsibacillus albus]RLQ93429.1 PAS domain S-box protein [Falsibacillus albus]
MLTKKKWQLLSCIILILWISQLILGSISYKSSFLTTTYLTLSISSILIAGYMIWSGYQFFMKYQKLEWEEKRLSTLINSMPDFVCFKDGEGRWLKVNQFGIDLYELHGIDYRSKTDIEIGELTPFFKDAFHYCVESDEEAWQSRTLTRTEESFVIPSGEEKTFDVIKVPLFHRSGKRKALVTIGRDISQQKSAEAMLLKKEKLSVVGEIAAGIAHEIRNPLTSLRGFIQLMYETKSVTKDYLEIMSSEIDRINQIVSELLVLAKPQSKSNALFNFHDALDYVLNVMRHEAMLKGIELKLESSQDAQIFGDKNQIIQVLINIVKNGIDAMDNGGTIAIQEEIVGNELKVVIIDEGIGIPEDRLNRLGEPFFTLKEKGMGLGLTISNKIIHDHKGTLDINSCLGEGTTVQLSLPVS